jgi:hypothetical protein
MIAQERFDPETARSGKGAAGGTAEGRSDGPGGTVGSAHLTPAPTQRTLGTVKTSVARKKRRPELLARDIRPDAKNRIVLGKALKGLDAARFDVYRNDLGQIILDPVVSIPASEAWLFRSKKALDAVRRGLREMADGRTVSAGSFARYANEE